MPAFFSWASFSGRYLQAVPQVPSLPAYNCPQPPPQSPPCCSSFTLLPITSPLSFPFPVCRRQPYQQCGKPSAAFPAGKLRYSQQMFALKDQICMDYAACGACDVTQKGNVQTHGVFRWPQQAHSKTAAACQTPTTSEASFGSKK